MSLTGIRENILAMKGYVPGFQPEDDGWVKLNQNENPCPPSEKAMAGVTQALSRARIYPESSSRGVREAAAKVYPVAPEQVLVCNGSDETLRILLQAYAGPGDQVVAFYPSYTYYKTLTAIQGAEYRLIEFNEDYSLPAELDLQEAKLVFLPNPNAPSGNVYSEAEIGRLCEAMPNGLVVMDEAYADFAGTTALPLLNRYSNLFVTRTFSKSYSLAGLRLGLGFGRQEVIEQLDKVRDYYNVDCVAQAVAEAALLDQETLRRNTEAICHTRSRLEQGLKQLGIAYLPSQANFVLARFESPSAKAVFDALLERRILVRHFASRRLEDCLRITVGTDKEIDILLTALKEIVSS